VVKQGKILFGILLRYDEETGDEEELNRERWLHVGQEVYPTL
jgi:hypothetical protein